MKNIVICAAKGVGKSTLVAKLLDELSKENPQRKIYGFITKKFSDIVEDELSPIYIYPVGSSPIMSDENLIGLGGQATHYVNTEVFDELGVAYLCVPENEKEKALIIMDEVGFLESAAYKFRQKVIDCITGDIPCLVMMKQKMTEPFMQEIKALYGIDFIDMTPENRDDVYKYVLEKLR